MGRVGFWWGLATVLSLAIGALGVVLTYLALTEPEPESSVVFETISETDILDLRRPLQDLSILFRGQNIQEQNLNLRIITFSVTNTGEVDIIADYYDPGSDWGIKVENGEVISATLVGAKSEYLRTNAVPYFIGMDTIGFPKVIFDAGDSFAIEVVLLHEEDKSPVISPVGKIAGIREMTVLAQPFTDEEVAPRTLSFSDRLQEVLAPAAGIAVALAMLSGLISLLIRSYAERRGPDDG